MEHGSGVPEAKYTAFVPPPPPPLPPPSIHKCSKSKERIQCKEYKTFSNNDSVHDEQISVLKHTFSNTDSKLISYNKPIHSIIQEGPSCGIVALSMATQFFRSVEVCDILKLAKELHFTKSGEIFSTHNMAVLASTLLSCDTYLVDNLQNCKKLILSHICRGHPVLVPYDADKNHSPCLNNGKTAHWAILSGLCFSLPIDHLLNLDVKFEAVADGLKVYVIDDNQSSNIIPQLDYTEKVYVYAKQGKSRHLALWDLDMLLLSNNNLFEVTQKYDTERLLLPEGDALCELRDKAVILKAKR